MAAGTYRKLNYGDEVAYGSLQRRAEEVPSAPEYTLDSETVIMVWIVIGEMTTLIKEEFEIINNEDIINV